jgi:hypothetical protein
MPGEPGAKKVEPEIGDAQDARVNVKLYQRYTGESVFISPWKKTLYSRSVRGVSVDLFQIRNPHVLQLHIRAVVLALVSVKVDVDTHVPSPVTLALARLVKSQLV